MRNRLIPILFIILFMFIIVMPVMALGRGAPYQYPGIKVRTGGLTSTGGNLAVQTSTAVNKFTVTAASGNTAISGTATVTGATALNGGLTMDTNKFTVADTSGNVATAGTLSATGNFAINTNKFTVTASSGNTAVAGTLGVTGATTLAGLTNYKFGTINTDTTGAVAVTAADTGELFIATKSDGATTFTLPDPSAATVGCVWVFIQTADQAMNVVPTTANGNSIIADGVATSDKVSIETGSHKIGGAIKVIGISATKYVAVADSGATMTVEAAD